MREQRSRAGAERFKTLATIRFSEAGPRELVVSVSKGRIVLGQKVIFKLDGGGAGHVFMKNSPSLDADQAQSLIDALNLGIQELMSREVSASMDRNLYSKEEDRDG